MTAKPLLTALLPLVSDLSRDLPERERYRRLLQSLRTLLPCDATALLRLDGDCLVPLAVDGLSTDTLGRRFKVSEHPRFEILLNNPGPTRFDSDTTLPDPYDGLVDGLHEDLHVHDCLGCPLFVEERPWGLLTLDALDPQRFDSLDLDALEAFASMAAATVTVAERMDQLAMRAEDEHQRAEVYRQASGQQPHEMIGQSPALQRLGDEIRLVGGSDLTVLITGETGVGKELVAQAIHQASPRARQPLISLNCAALPDTLVESELFGHVRGAFTGATSDRRGKFELANGGTLFLDEIESMSLDVQVKLLRLLQERVVERLGGNQLIPLDIRIIAATKEDLRHAADQGRFRADLYYRLNVASLRIPALRERGEDALILFSHFADAASERHGLLPNQLQPGERALLLRHGWPGNVRELQNAAERFALGLDLELEHSAPTVPGTLPAPMAGNLSEQVENFERALIAAEMAKPHGSLRSLAEALGVPRKTLHDKLRKHGLNFAAGDDGEA